MSSGIVAKKRIIVPVVTFNNTYTPSVPISTILADNISFKDFSLSDVLLFNHYHKVQ